MAVSFQCMKKLTTNKKKKKDKSFNSKILIYIHFEVSLYQVIFLQEI